MERNGYGKNVINHYVLEKKFSDGNFIIQLIYVDDILIFGPDTKKIVVV